MAVLTGVSVLVGAAPVLWLINADIQQTGLGTALFMSALAGCFASIAGERPAEMGGGGGGTQHGRTPSHRCLVGGRCRGRGTHVLVHVMCCDRH